MSDLMVQDGREKICIVGFCETNRHLAPYDDPSWVIVGLNRGYIFMPKADVWFDMHSPTIRGWEHRRPKGHMKWLKSFDGPVYMHEVDPDLPNSREYPLAEVAEDLGEGFWRIGAKDGQLTSAKKQPYMDSSIAYEIGLAIHEGYKEISVVGVDLNTAGEYVWQRSGVSYLLGLAQGRGIKVFLPDNCPLLTGPLYGRGFLSAKGEHMSDEQLTSRLTALRQQQEHLVRELCTVQGAHKELEFVVQQMFPGVDREQAEQRLNRMNAKIQEFTAEISRCEGALKETLYWIHQTPGGQDPEEAIHQIEESLMGRKFEEQPSEGDLDAFSDLAISNGESHFDGSVRPRDTVSSGGWAESIQRAALVGG